MSFSSIHSLFPLLFFVCSCSDLVASSPSFLSTNPVPVLSAEHSRQPLGHTTRAPLDFRHSLVRFPPGWRAGPPTPRTLSRYSTVSRPNHSSPKAGYQDQARFQTCESQPCSLAQGSKERPDSLFLHQHCIYSKTQHLLIRHEALMGLGRPGACVRKR